VKARLLQLLKSPAILAMLPVGFASGLPLALSGGTLQAWLTVAGVDIRTIGLFSMVGLPYTLKFLWSPLLDRYALPFLGRRRGWIVLLQLALALDMAAMARIDPAGSPGFMAAAALLLAFFSASQDIAIDAYRTDLLKARQRGLGVATFVTAYRAAMLVSGALAMILADRIGWSQTYLLMASIMAASAGATLLIPKASDASLAPRSLRSAVIEPLRELLSRPGAFLILLLIVLYKIGDAFAGTLTVSFLIRGAGFTPTEVGAINKALGLGATIAGAFAGGAIMTRLGLYGSLMLFGILQAVSNLSFMALSFMGRSFPMMVAAVGFENVSGGMGTAAFVALLMALCNKRFSATQYALLSALAAIGRVFVGPPSGFIVARTGWAMFFFITFLAALPGLLLLRAMKRQIASYDKEA